MKPHVNVVKQLSSVVACIHLIGFVATPQPLSKVSSVLQDFCNDYGCSV